MRGPYLIFDKSSLESLNFDEAVMLDNFYSSVITPMFFVECLADLEKQIRSNSTPEQLVGSLANRTPEDGTLTIHHLDVLRFELAGEFSMVRLRGGPFVAGGRSVQLGESKGMMFLPTKEQEAMQRWVAREFLEAERNYAKLWRRALMGIDLDAMSKSAMAELGPHWRKSKTLQDAREMADVLIDHMDPEWLLGFGIDLLGVSELKEQVITDWVARRRPPLRDCFPYFIFMLSINIFFYLVLQTQLLSNVKASHQIDLAYLYYLPFCSVFTSKDNFHAQIVPLFLKEGQTYVNGIELKNDLKKLVERYLALDEAEFNMGMDHYAKDPPDDTSFLTTQLWDKHTPKWRNPPAPVKLNEQLQRALGEVKKLGESPEVPPHNLGSVGDLDYVKMEHKIHLRRGKWRRYSEEMEMRIIESENT